ncbi:unnamed protein product [Closterium sp. NIES-54]
MPGTHRMALRPSSVPLRVVLTSPPASSLPHVPDPELDLVRAASPTVTHLLATVVNDPSFESAAMSTLVAELVDFAALCHLDYAAKPSGSCTSYRVHATLPWGDPDALDISTPRTYAEAITREYSSQWQIAMDAEMASRKSTGTYVNEVPPPRANIVDGMWIFRVKRPSGSPPVFKARFVAPGFSQREGVDFLHTFSPTPKMTTSGATARCSTARLQVALPRLLDSLRAGQPSRGHLVLQRFEFTWSSPQPTPLSIGHSLSAPPSDESVEPSGPYPELVGCLMYLITCTRPDLAYPLSLLARYVALGRHQKMHWDAAKRALRYLCSTSGMGFVLGGPGSVVLTGHSDASWIDDQTTHRSTQGYSFNLDTGSVSWRSTRSSSVLRFSCEAEIYAGAMAAQELRWLNYLLTDLDEQPRSPPVLYVDNKAMIALCPDQRLEHRTKHIALHYFLTRELQQCGKESHELGDDAVVSNESDIEN